MNKKKIIICVVIITMLNWPTDTWYSNWLTGRNNEPPRKELVFERDKSILDGLTFE